MKVREVMSLKKWGDRHVDTQGGTLLALFARKPDAEIDKMIVRSEGNGFLDCLM